MRKFFVCFDFGFEKKLFLWLFLMIVFLFMKIM